jgi:hypothetical protein
MHGSEKSLALKEKFMAEVSPRPSVFRQKACELKDRSLVIPLSSFPTSTISAKRS